MLTAVIALSIGVALVSWLKGDGEDARPALQTSAPTASAAPAAGPGRGPWAHRSEPAQPTPSRWDR